MGHGTQDGGSGLREGSRLVLAGPSKTEGLGVKTDSKLGSSLVRREVAGGSRPGRELGTGQPQSWATEGSC